MLRSTISRSLLSSLRSSSHQINRSLITSSLIPLTTTSSLSPKSSSPSSTFKSPQIRHFQNILSPNPDSTDAPNLAINKLTSRGFILSDNLVIPGGCIFHSGRAILWDVNPPKNNESTLDLMWKEWNKDMFRVFEVTVPRPEILIFGTGKTAIPAPKSIRDYISSLGIQLDVMDTRNAASTYNLLAEEGRTVAAALCPLEPIDPKTGEAR